MQVLAGRETARPALQSARSLQSARWEVVAGETVTVHGQKSHQLTIPDDAAIGQRVWRQLENAWIDFSVVPALETRGSISGGNLRLSVRSNLPSARQIAVSGLGETREITLQPQQTASLVWPLGTPQNVAPRALQLSLQVLAAGAQRAHAVNWQGTLATREDNGLVQTLGSGFSAGIGVRNESERQDLDGTGAIVAQQNGIKAGNIARDGIFIHPPWQNGVGYSFALWRNIQLPANPAAFRAFAGKTDGSAPGDGIVFKVLVLDAQKQVTTVAQQSVTTHGWQPIEADLTPWSGQKIAIKLVSDVGEKNDSGGDWSAWAQTRIEARQTRRIYVLEAEK